MRRWSRLAVPALLTTALIGGLVAAPNDEALAAAVRIDTSATASKVAIPGTSVQMIPLQSEPGCTPPDSVPASARQVVRVDASGTSASVDLLQQIDGAWQCTRRDMTGRVGKNGVRPLAERVSGDGTTPAGTFPLASMTAPDGQTFQFFGNGTNPGVQGTWRQVRPGDCWDASGGDAAYNTLTSRPQASCIGDDEYLPSFTEAYSRAALIGANMGPDRSGDQPGETPRAAAIFLHRFSYDGAGNSKPTSGCVSLAGDDLDAVLRALVPGEAWFVITA